MKICLTLFLTYFSLHLSAQTFIGPTLSYDMASLHTAGRVLQEGYMEDGYWHDLVVAFPADDDTPAGRRSIGFGFQAQKMLSKRLFLGIRGNYTKKEHKIIVDDGRPIIHIMEYKHSYQQFGLSILLNQKIKEKFSIGIGPNISFFTQWGAPTHVPQFEQFRVNKRAYGLDLQIGYYLESFFLAADYTRALKISDASGYLTGTSSLAISGTYFFELRKRK